MTRQAVRIFISSPSDVFAERERVERVIVRLNGEFGGGLLEAIRWERSYYTAARTFQDQILLPSQTDLVICILWKRLGYELPPEYRRDDGTTPTGTEYEFENAMAAARSNGTPDVLVYRKAAPVLLDADQVEVERAQFEALKTFWSRWFRNEAGNFTAAYQTFETTDLLEREVEDHLRQWLSRRNLAASGVVWPIALHGSPFRGLQAFDSVHAPVFFGRRRAVERALERLADAASRGTPFLLLLGASGAGKSSVARAGLQPRVTQPGTVPGVDLWRACTMRPSEGDTPIHALARALYNAQALPELAAGDNPTAADFAGLLATAPSAATGAVRAAMGRGTAATAAREGFERAVVMRLLLTVDQFEEALQPADSRDAFARALAALAGSGLVWVVATLRSDLYASFQACAPLMALREGGAQLDLLPPSLAELSEIVTGPAAAAGMRFDTRPDGTGLEEELVAAADQPGALPLLQLALDALFESREPVTNLLTCAAYDAGGGLSGVVERRAEATLAALDAEAAASLPELLRTLVDVTEDGVVTSRAAPPSERPARRRLADAFVAARLLVAVSASDGLRLRVAHDALLAGWPRAAALIAADREMLRARGRVERAARRWVGEGRDADYLLPPGRPLAEAAELASHKPDGLDDDSAAFIAASQEAELARIAARDSAAQHELRLEAEAQQVRADAAHRVVRRTRWAAALVSGMLALATGAAFYANAQRREAELQTTKAGQQAARAEDNFRAALDGGASLIAAVDAHLSDGGMTRRVARELLATADAGLGTLLPKGGDAVLPAGLLDTDSRLQASFSRVLIAVCEDGEARTRAERAVALAEAALKQGPADARALSLMNAEDDLGQAIGAQGDWTEARAVLQRAETRAAGHDGEDWKAGLQRVRRDLAYTMSDGKDRDRTVAIVQDDLAWQTVRLRTRPGDPAILAEQAADYRQLAIAARVDKDVPAVTDAVDREADLLRRLEAMQPDNLAWQRFLAQNARAKSILLDGAGDPAGALSLARDASARAAALLTHDPGNALWRILAINMDVRLAIMLMRRGDEPGARAVLRPDLQAVKALATPGAGRMCTSEAAQMQSAIGNALVVMGDGEESVAVLEAAASLVHAMAAAAPQDPVAQYQVVQAEKELARASSLTRTPNRVMEHARLGIAALRPLLAADPGKTGWIDAMSELRLLLGDAQMDAGDAEAAVDTFAGEQAAAQALLDERPTEERWRVALAIALIRKAAAEAKAGRAVDQWTALQAAASGLEPLAGRVDIPPAWQKAVIELRQAIGTAEIVRRDVVAALADYRTALAAAEALVAGYPADPQARSLLAQSLAWVGVGYRFNGQTEEAAAYAARSQAVYAAMLPKHPSETVTP